MANKQLILTIVGGQMRGFGATLNALDPDDKGTDDLIGHLLNSGGSVIVAAGVGNLKGQKQAVTAIRDACNVWLDNPS